MSKLSAVLLLIAFGICFCRISPAHATITVQVLETDPPGEVVTLGNGQNFYLHLRYTSDKPVLIWARPYFEGKEVDARSNGSNFYPAGTGEALGWFSLDKPNMQVDEVRISAGDGFPTMGGVDGNRLVPSSSHNASEAALSMCSVASIIAWLNF